MPTAGQVAALREEAVRAVDAAEDADALEAVRIAWLGRKAGRIPDRKSVV